jgi:hypothetical protein
MAKGFIDKGLKGVRKFDRDFASATLIGAIKSAEKIVSDLQQEGPSWTGRFSNSWQIAGPQGQSIKGDGGKGEARPIKFKDGPFTGPQATATLFRTTVLKDKTVFTISNFSEHAAEAIDAVEHDKTYYPKGWQISPEGPQTSQGTQNHKTVGSGRKSSSTRGDIGGGDPNSMSSRTAPLDWFSTFAEGGRLDKAIKIEMDKALGRAFRK